jgi:SAM-dependent methyltransferase
VKNTVYTNVQELLTEVAPPTNPYHKTHLKRYGRTLSVLLDEKPLKGKLLEVGTSKVYPLVLQKLVPDLQVHVTDYDLSKPQKGSLTISSGEQTRKVPVYRVDIETTPLPVEDETFDYIICGEVLEHLERDPMFMMSELNRVMKPNGLLVLTTPNIASSHGISRLLRSQDPYFYMQYRKAGTLDRHNYEYSPHSVAQVMKASGFTGKIWTEDSFGVASMTDIDVLRKVGFSLEHIGDNIFSVGLKVGPVTDRYPSVIYAD